MISEKISIHTLQKISAIYWDAPCRYKDSSDGKWHKGRIGIKTMDAVSRRECILLLRPLTKLTLDVIESIMNITGDTLEYHDLSKENFSSFIADFIEGIDMAPYAAIDFLRRNNFCVNVYGLDLFRAGIAEEIDTEKWQLNDAKKKARKAIPRPFGETVHA